MVEEENVEKWSAGDFQRTKEDVTKADISSSTGFHFLSNEPTDKVRKVDYESEANKTAAYLQRFFNFSGFPDFLILRTFKGEDLFRLVPVNYDLVKFLTKKGFSSSALLTGVFFNNRGMSNTFNQFILETKKVVKYLPGAHVTYNKKFALEDLRKKAKYESHRLVRKYTLDSLERFSQRVKINHNYANFAERLLYEISEFFKLRRRKKERDAKVDALIRKFSYAYGYKTKMSDFFVRVVKDDRKYIPEDEKRILFAVFPINHSLIKFESKLRFLRTGFRAGPLLFNVSGKYTAYSLFGRSNTVKIGNLNQLEQFLRGFTYTSDIKKAYRILDRIGKKPDIYLKGSCSEIGKKFRSFSGLVKAEAMYEEFKKKQGALKQLEAEKKKAA